MSIMCIIMITFIVYWIAPQNVYGKCHFANYLISLRASHKIPY